MVQDSLPRKKHKTSSKSPENVSILLFTSRVHLEDIYFCLWYEDVFVSVGILFETSSLCVTPVVLELAMRTSLRLTEIHLPLFSKFQD